MNKMKMMLLMAAMSVLPTMKAVALNLMSEGGWLETAYATWQPVEGAASYEVSYSGEGLTNVKVDAQLVRFYDGYVRVDVPGLKAGSYTLTVKAMDAEGQQLDAATTNALTVKVQKREGFAFTEGVVPGGYNLDGTVKNGAKIIYVSAKTVNTVTCEVSDSKSTATYTGLANILTAYGQGYDKTPLIVRVMGTIKAAQYEGLKDGKYINFEGKNNTTRMLENVTLEGIGCDATLYGYGINMKRTKGIELRNLGIMLYGDDAITMDTDNFHAWVHNCDFFYGSPGPDADQVKGDGCIDMKYRSTLATISYNHFFDNGKVMGCGGATGETVNLLLTFHHNWFDHCDSRTPRLNRTTAHVYNNYYDGMATYSIGCTDASNAFIEANYFRNVQRPMMIAGQGTDTKYASDPNKGTFSGQAGGMSKAYNNVVDNTTVELRLQYQDTDAQQFDAWLVENRNDKVPETVSAVKGGHIYNNFDTAEDMYAYAADQPDEVPAIVEAYAGRENGGDLHWVFNNEVDDRNHDVNTELKAALTSYEPTLLQVQGEPEGGSEGGEGGEGGDTPGDTPTTVTKGGYVIDLMNDANSGFTIVGGTSNSKGTVTVNDVTYNTCVKMGSSSSVTFSISEPMVMTLYFAASATKRISVTGLPEITIPESNIVTCTLPAAGEYTIKRTSGESYLYYIALSPTASTGIESIVNCQLSIHNCPDAPAYNLAGQKVDKNYKGIVIVNGRKKFVK